MELINKGGQTFFVPVGDRDGSLAISNFQKWEQAFRIFSNVYLQQFPHKATELLQYNHIIFTALLSFTWHNVYTYDKEFRNHLVMFPECSWGIILQQAWSMCLKDKISLGHESNGNYGGRFNTSTPKSRKEICKCFNKGICTTGRSCKYDHRCLECGKFGHGMHICQKRINQVANNNITSTMTMPVASTSQPK